MTIPAKKVLWVMLPMAVFLIWSHVLAKEQSQSDQTSGAQQESAAAAPDLADIIPLTTELSGRLSALENELTGLLDISVVEKKYAGIEERLKDLAGQLQRLKDSKEFSPDQLRDLQKAIGQENALFEKISKPLNKAIRQLGVLRKSWLGEKKRWNEWQASLLKEGEPDQIESAVAKAHETIESALTLTLPQFEAMLKVQEKAGIIHVGLNALAAEIAGVVGKRDVLIEASPPMFSSQYFSQFKGSCGTCCIKVLPGSHGRTAGFLFERDGSFSSRVSFLLL